MAEIGVHEAKTQFSKLLRRVALGEEIVITRNRQAVARLMPPSQQRGRRLGTAEGLMMVPDDFDAPLPDDVLAEFER